jgi:flagellar protein FliL
MTKQKTNDDAPKKGGKGKKIILISLAVLMVAGGSAGAGLYAAGGFSKDEKPEDPNRPKLVERSAEHDAPEAEAGKEAPPKIGTVAVKSDTDKVDPRKFEMTYFPIEQNLTSNLSDGQGFVQVGLSLATYYDGKIIANIKRQLVPIRSAILLTLSQQAGTVLATPEGKDQLQQQLTRSINRVLREKEGFGGIDNVYFTTLVIQ